MPPTPVLVALLVCLEPEQDPAPGAPPIEAAPKPLSDAEARAAVAEFGKASRAKDARLAQRVEAVEALGRDRHPLLVKPLSQAVQRDSSMTVRKRAAELLGHQPPKEARRALLVLIAQADQAPEVVAALVDSLSRAGYAAGDWNAIEPLFEREFDEKHSAVQRAILRLVAQHKEKRAWRLLLRHIDEPVPADVDGASNPPADYWERRWKAWRVWRAEAKEALFAITGQRFSSSEEARIWIKQNGAKVGLG